MTVDREASPRYDVVVVGAGFSGLCAAIKLAEAGIDNYVVLEKAERVGGTWRDNDYPGAACDVMAQLYSFSFAPNAKWTKGYPGQAEILTYLEDVVRQYDLSPKIEFGVEVVDQRFDDGNDEWQLTTADGTTWRAGAVIAATGPLHIPKIPAIAGRNSFEGNQFHSSRWDHTVDLAGKSVAVIGTGASAVQIVPAIADKAGSVSVFQRTPHWVLPRLQRPITTAERVAYRVLPGSRKALRGAIYGSHELFIGAFMNPKYMGALRSAARLHLRTQIRDESLRAKLEPNYEIGCKRILISTDFYPALERDDVSLVTDAIDEIVPSGIRTADGDLHPADVIVYATGFKTTEQVVDQQLEGKDGVPIQQLWADGPEAYFGVAVHGLPNYFLTVGPNSGVGNQSIVFIIETQIELIVRCIRAMRDGEFTRVEVKSHVQADFNRDLQKKSAGTVWTAGGCDSWYLDQSGVNRAIWPGSTMSYRRQVRRIPLGDFDFSSLADREADDYYAGTAILVAANGAELRAEVRIIARYEPLANAIKWSGRVRPHPGLAQLHTEVSQPITLQIDGRDAVDAVLVDSDPWGGAHIIGRGRSPYPIDLEAQFVERAEQHHA
jgi:cation diffusion facilitator CzcD-associated flavoprotein CzcO